jgi:predicted NBD/HSP70 family sugar kinase
LTALEEAGVICNLGVRMMTGRGRPAEELGLAPTFGVILVADLGIRAVRLGVYDAGQSLLAYEKFDVDLASGPEPTLQQLTHELKGMVDRLPPEYQRALVLVVGLPGPVDTGRGVAVKPPIMPGWDEFPVAEFLKEKLGCPVLCENDVNIRALGEARALPEDQSPLLYIKVSSGIGGGLVTGRGELYHGADGAAGDIGHIRVPHAREVACACGGFGCVEALASAPAILSWVRADTETDDAPTTIEDLYAAIRNNNRVAVAKVREAASQIGDVVADLVHFYNPARVVVGGSLTVPSDEMLAGVRAVVYQRALPLATRNLVITKPVLGECSGLSGALVIGQEFSLTPDSIGDVLDTAMQRRRAALR